MLALSEPLKDARHEQFAQLLATGMEKMAAYKQVYPKALGRSAKSAAPRLFSKVVARVRELQDASATRNTLTMIERRERLARMVRCDLEDFDPARDGDLLQEKTITTTGPSTTVKYKLPGKRECIMDDAKLAGELPDGGGTNVQVNVGCPQIVVNAPPSFFEDRGK